MTTIADTSVVIAVTVDAPIEHCFKVFTDDFSSWWPSTHHIREVEMADCRIEPRAGGRWYEIGVDGAECDWGSVLDWDPPLHVGLSWHLNPEFKYDPDPARASRVDVRFTDLGDGRTQVELEHSQLDRHGDGWEQLKAGVGGDGGWRGLLGLFADRASSR